jgi:hypothetical protein
MAKGQRKQKGGRTANLLVRLEPDVKAWLMEQGSAADWITRKVREEQDAKDVVIERP